MNASDVLCQIRTGVEALGTEVPAAGVRHRLGPGGADTALSVHHSRGGAPTGHGALHLHQGAADAEGGEGGLVERERDRDEGGTQSHCHRTWVLRPRRMSS